MFAQSESSKNQAKTNQISLRVSGSNKRPSGDLHVRRQCENVVVLIGGDDFSRKEQWQLLARIDCYHSRF